MDKLTLDFTLVSGDNVEQYKEDILEILAECNNDFVPPLTKRDASIGDWNEKDTSGDLPIEYYNTLLDGYFVILKQGDEVVGFTAFKHKITLPFIPEMGESNYLSTTCIKHKYRSTGLGTRLYEYVETQLPDDMKLPYITRRTWSTNYNQLHIYEKLGYELFCTIENHRGEGIHTLYYRKKLY